MKWETFQHPDISFPVVRRKVSTELMTLLGGTAKLILTKGADELYGHCYPNRRSYHASISRLRKKGLLVKPHNDGTLPGLHLTPEGQSLLPDYYSPDIFWSKKWNHRWYVLMFDVPETERHYRNTLRAFLKRLRFGCLQKSVWVSPWDVRPEYDDLDRAAAVDSIAFLFEAVTVLGHGNQSVVTEAWDFEMLNKIQSCYIDFVDKNLNILDSKRFPQEDLLQLLRSENAAYSQAMFLDPLLPRELHPPNYLGEQVLEHRMELTKQISEQI